MILVRNVFRAQVGRAGELAQLMADSFRRAAAAGRGPAAWRVLTDLSGPFDTVVVEGEAESLAVWERSRTELFASPEFRAFAERGAELVVSGRSEFYTIEARG